MAAKERNEVILSEGNGLQSTKLLADKVNAVCYIETAIIDPSSRKERLKRGTGFLSRLTKLKSFAEVYGVFTNNHVLGTENEAEKAYATFGYEGSNKGEKVKLKPDIMFRTNKDLDYTFVGVNKEDFDGLNLTIEPILVEPEPELKKGENVMIIQHPKGQPKHFSQEKILNVEKPFVFYKADTENGSSGSPVLTSEGLVLIAIHHKGSEELSYNKGTLTSEILMHLQEGTYTKNRGSLSDSQDKEIFEVDPLPKRVKMSQGNDESHEQPSEEVLENLSQDIVSFWKPLGRKLKVVNVKLEEIQGDNIQYPGIKEKAYQMLLAWIDQEETATFHHLSGALQSLGKNRLAHKYCGTS
ncbi:uncharacterized protein LOC111333589 [Stylophora pistillata]|uniref:Uncharacterized protein y4fB n=1 Tax=Stylophora pistillata TaxID=50429 RepID=A0A2B4S345_STYPI|nr:uncharacterized protein LOC111333589 [Stylophora pistillata]PFX22942.1 Uncharacterized protein y4fB [Stylophora pistillata]